VNLIGNRGGSTAYSASWDTAALTVNAVDGAAVPGGESGTVGYAAGAPPLAVVPSATISDVRSESFAGGQLRVRIAQGLDAADLLAISGGFYVDESSQIFRGTTLVGTRTNDGENELVIAFHANIKRAIAQQLLRSITFATSGDAVGERKIHFLLSDIDGDSIAELSKTVQLKWPLPRR
jgi:hypothetical protein